MLAAFTALLECEQVLFVRTKDRWAPEYDVGKTGGYRDLQAIALVRVGDGWSLCEVQFNLYEFVRIKATSHGPFEAARSVDANSPAVTEWVGEPTADVIERIGTGVLVKADFNRAALDGDTVRALAAAGEGM